MAGSNWSVMDIEENLSLKRKRKDYQEFSAEKEGIRSSERRRNE
jgi:hypothetical protein